MRLLLDTHILLWWLARNARLSNAARIAIEESDEAFVSAATAWEIAIKISQRKLEFRGDLERHLTSNRFLSLPVSVAHAIAAGSLPLHHRDPFDRMLVAQASLESLTLLTADARLKAYDVRVMLA